MPFRIVLPPEMKEAMSRLEWPTVQTVLIEPACFGDYFSATITRSMLVVRSYGWSR